MKNNLPHYINLILNLWLMFVMSFLSYMILVVIPQSHEVFLDIGNGAVDINIVLFTGITLLFWSLAIWFGSRKITQVWLAHNPGAQSMTGNKAFDLIVKYLPRFLGTTVLISFIVGVYTHSHEINWINLSLPLCMLLIYIAIVWYRRDFYRDIEKENDWQRSKWKDFNPLLKRSLVAIAAAYVILMLLFCDTDIEIWISERIGPLAVLGLGLGFFTFFGATLRYIDISSKLPTSLLLVFVFVFVSKFNNNDGIQRTEKAEYGKIAEKDIAAYFENWYKSDQRKGDTANVIIVAGQGGGSRASYWASSLLAHYDLKYDDFFNSLFAISTVSGSSAGSGFYSSYKRLKLDGKIHEDSSMIKDLRCISGRDFLSPNTAPMFFQELLQAVLPFGMRWTDRAKYLEEAWSSSFKKVTFDSASLDQHYLCVYDTVHTMPLQFFNTTVVERGMQGVIAPFLPYVHQHQYHNEVLLVSEFEKNIPLKTAMSLSARFPFLTSPGTVYIGNDEQLNMADGGYYENTGIGTALLIYQELDNIRWKKKLNFNIKIVYLKNGKGDYFKNDKELIAGKIISVPVSAFYSCWDTESSQIYDFAKMILESTKVENDTCNTNKIEDEFIIKELNYPDVLNERGYPLSRYLSEATKKGMNEQVDTMSLSFGRVRKGYKKPKKTCTCP